MCSKSVILFLIVCQVRNSYLDTCDEKETPVAAGNVGQIGTFPWLGVIRVHLHEGTELRIALTGCILVKTAHAIAIADDIAKIPRKIFLKDSKAMFYPLNNQPWLCSMKDYLLHPEYEYATFNTIALIELEPDTTKDGTVTVPVLPICWPSYLFNASNQLYTLGYTDERQILEKVIHKVQFIDKSLCEGFYERAGLKEYRHTPTHYMCGLAGAAAECQWDNGMALASNSSGAWVLIGLGTKGPGCSAPSRFIELYPYLQWIETSTTNIELIEDADYPYRKSAFGLGFKGAMTTDRIREIPIHKMFRSGAVNIPPMPGQLYDEEETMLNYNIERLDKDAIVIAKFKHKYERFNDSCSPRKRKFLTLVYQDTAKIYAGPEHPSADPGKSMHSYNRKKIFNAIGSYKVAVMDNSVNDITCITIRVECKDSTDTYLWYSTSMEVNEPASIDDMTPSELIKIYPLPNSTSVKKQKEFEQNRMEPKFIVDEPVLRGRILNLFLRFRFLNEAYLKVQVWGPRPRQKPNHRRGMARSGPHHISVPRHGSQQLSTPDYSFSDFPDPEVLLRQNRDFPMRWLILQDNSHTHDISSSVSPETPAVRTLTLEPLLNRGCIQTEPLCLIMLLRFFI